MSQTPRTAFVFAGGGSLGAIEVGMLRTLLARGYAADLVAGASAGALNAAYFAGAPTPEGVARLEAVWRGLRRQDVFPITVAGGVRAVLRRRDHLVAPAAFNRLLERHLPYRDLEAAQIPCCIVASDLLHGIEVRMRRGPLIPALLASTAIPGVFPPVRRNGHYLVDGGVTNHTPISAAIDMGATRVFVLPTGYSCDLRQPPRGLVATALHSLNLIITRRLVLDIRRYRGEVDIHVVPPLCPLGATAFDFEHAGELIERAARSTEEWLDNGVEMVDGVPHQLPVHTHADVPDPYAAQWL